MKTAGSSNRDRSCGSAITNAADRVTGTGAERTAVRTAGLCEKTHSAQCDRPASEGANSCRWMACTSPSPAISNTAAKAVIRRNHDVSNWGTNLIPLDRYYT